MSVKFRIQCMSSERGWGKEHWTEDFDTVNPFQSADYHEELCVCDRCKFDSVRALLEELEKTE